MIEISGDSGEYEFLTEAVELSKDITGMCIEIGLRLGMGTKTIIDAIAQYCPYKIAVSVDPYGSQLYQPRDHVEPCRLDYTNEMRNICLGNIYPYSESKKVNFKFIELTDTDFFEVNKSGIIIYDIERFVFNKYSMVHLDGPHSVEAINTEIDWFYDRMSPGAMLVIDDISLDFIPIEKVEEHMGDRFECIKKGLKKGIWKRN